MRWAWIRGFCVQGIQSLPPDRPCVLLLCVCTCRLGGAADGAAGAQADATGGALIAAGAGAGAGLEGTGVGASMMEAGPSTAGGAASRQLPQGVGQSSRAADELSGLDDPVEYGSAVRHAAAAAAEAIMRSLRGGEGGGAGAMEGVEGPGALQGLVDMLVLAASR